MERITKEEKVKETEFLIRIWKENQEKYQEDELFFHYTQSIIDDLESELDLLKREKN